MKKKLKGFTLMEMVVVIAIVSILTGMIVPSMLAYIRRAKVAAAIMDAKTIKTSVEASLMSRFIVNSGSNDDISGAFNKILYLDQNEKKEKRQRELVGAFTNRSWRKYKRHIVDNSPSQIIDTVIAAGLDETFSESWKEGQDINPMVYGSSGTCADYLAKAETNFGLIVVYDSDFSVRMLQIYRKGILVTYINGEYIANTNKNAHFVGTTVWSTIYTDAGNTPAEGLYKVSLSNKQMSNGKEGRWY